MGPFVIHTTVLPSPLSLKGSSPHVFTVMSFSFTLASECHKGRMAFPTTSIIEPYLPREKSHVRHPRLILLWRQDVVQKVFLPYHFFKNILIIAHAKTKRKER
uniref:Uncharacterized protein n=1 Tax=Trypanosoma congolense (strain IL3000) TaxID=1068625 RepID=G0UPM2_TRYCI|nr:hypothetical protein, unlikely [Trypanosoma congolense IL3000]